MRPQLRGIQESRLAEEPELLDLKSVSGCVPALLVVLVSVLVTSLWPVAAQSQLLHALLAFVIFSAMAAVCARQPCDDKGDGAQPMSGPRPVGWEELQAAGEQDGITASLPPAPRVSAADSADCARRRRKRRRQTPSSAAAAADALCSPYSFLFSAASSASLFSSSVILASGQLPFPWINTVDTASPLTFFHSCENVATDSAPVPEDAAARIDWTQPEVDPRLAFDCCGCEERVGCSAAHGCSCALYTGARYSKPGSRRLAAAQQGAEYPTLITECNARCRCADFAGSCGNRVVQAAPVSCGVRLLVFRSADRGWGVLTLQSIPARSYVCEYIGEVVSEQAAELQRDPELGSSGSSDRFLFDTGGRFALEPPVVDAQRVGHIARFINHSCEPNLAVYQLLLQQRSPLIPHFAFFTNNRTIQQGEELSFNYGYGQTEMRRLFQGPCRCPHCKRRRQQPAGDQQQQRQQQQSAARCAGRQRPS